MCFRSPRSLLNIPAGRGGFFHSPPWQPFGAYASFVRHSLLILVIAFLPLSQLYQIVLTFRNAGPTIPPEKLFRMFEQFFRLDSSRGTRTGNAGLGLAIAKEIMEAHGGTIAARSEREEVLFTVTLPR